ncbi:MAG: ECF transporter S component [Clostridiales bacterium]|nr:ECF transporter S component [Clostridiales bacterium]
MKKKRKTYKLTMDALMAALCFVLGYLAIDMGFIKISFETLPILIGALLFGPLDGMIIGALGSLLYQFLKYGLSLTTVLWILPYPVFGLIVGRYALKRKFSLTRKQIWFIMIAGHLLVMVMNTAVIYIDSRIYGYYTFIYVFGSMILRLAVCIAEAVVFAVIVPFILKAIRRSLHLWDVD